MPYEERALPPYVKAFNIPDAEETRPEFLKRAGNTPINKRLIPCMQPVRIAIIRTETTACDL